MKIVPLLFFTLIASDRSISTQIPTVELGIFVDHSFVEKYYSLGHDIDRYIAKLVDIIQDVYHSPSLGHFIQLKVNHVVKLRHRFYKRDAGQLLTSFCSYQALYHEKFKNGPDHSVLITGDDLCLGDDKDFRSCQTVGLANIGSMCREHSSCTVAQDMGLATAFTVAHEMGHAFGILHDGDGNRCRQSAGMFMAPMLRSSSTGQFVWSSCSREQMNSFLGSNQAHCLYSTLESATFDENEHFVKPRSLTQVITKRGKPPEPATYSADEQCEMQFGKGTKVCSYGHAKDVCGQLHCQVGPYQCQSLMLPAAKGTACLGGSFNGVCRQGNCVLSGPQVIQSNAIQIWSDWSSTTSCPTQTCGPAVRFRSRQCQSKYCDGASTEVIQCPTKTCTDSVATTNVELALHCSSNNYYNSNVFASDGVACKRSGQHYCLEGNCIMVSCDPNEKAAKLDRCGKCNGNNDTCQKQREIVYPKSQNRTKSGASIYTFPIGATNIIINQKQRTRRPALTVGDINVDIDYREHKFISKVIDGTLWHYKRTKSNRDLLFATGPLKRSIDLKLMDQLHPGAFVHFYKVIEPDTYTVIHTESQCTRECGGGVMDIKEQCYSERLKITVPGHYCQITNNLVEKRRCNMHSCRPRWIVGDWGSCSAKCGLGSIKRNVKCRQLKHIVGDTTVPDSVCKQYEAKPVEEKACKEAKCKPEWRYGRSWSPCSTNCGRGRRERHQICVLKLDSGRYKRQNMLKCAHVERLPEKIHQCHGEHCPSRVKRKRDQWTIGPWSKCSTSCGLGMKKRTVTCKKAPCSGRTPPDWQKCNLPSCPVQQKRLESRDLSRGLECRDTKSSCKTYVVQYDLCRFDNIRKICCETCQD